MFNRLAAIEEKYETLTERLSDPETIKDRNLFMRLSKEQSDLKPIVDKFREYKKILSAIEEDEEVLSSGDKELKVLAEEELEDLRQRKAEVVEELKLMLLPKDPRDEKNVIIEIRAGTGGEEAALFAADLFKMYSRYAEQKRWKVEVIESRPTGLGGLKEITVAIQDGGLTAALNMKAVFTGSRGFLKQRPPEGFIPLLLQLPCFPRQRR